MEDQRNVFKLLQAPGRREQRDLLMRPSAAPESSQQIKQQEKARHEREDEDPASGFFLFGRARALAAALLSRPSRRGDGRFRQVYSFRHDGLPSESNPPAGYLTRSRY